MTLSLCGADRYIFVSKTESAFFAVRTQFLYQIWKNLCLRPSIVCVNGNLIEGYASKATIKFSYKAFNKFLVPVPSIDLKPIRNELSRQVPLKVTKTQVLKRQMEQHSKTCGFN
jgi:hypothetical protein